jgi:hypothetical protein
MAVPYMFYRRLGVADEDVKLRSSVGRLCAAGCDIAGVHTLSYGGGGASPALTRTAVAHCSWNYMLPNEVVLHGTRGILRLNSVWAAAEISLSGPVSRSRPCIGSPCLKHCVHGASIGHAPGRARARPRGHSGALRGGGASCSREVVGGR